MSNGVGSVRPPSPWPRSTVRAAQREVLVVPGCGLPVDHRASRPHTLDLNRSSTDRVHFSPRSHSDLRRARGSYLAGGAREKRRISSSIGIQIWCEFSTSTSQNPSLTLPACAPAQVNVDFLDGEEWARSTSFSRSDFRIFDILFVLVDVGNLLARCVARARLPSLLVPPPCLCAQPLCSPSL